MEVVNYPYAFNRTADLAYTILLQIGGTMADVENIYASTEDDLLYAILKVLADKKNLQFVDGYKVGVTNDNRSVVNYPGIIGANGIVVSIGGANIETAVSENRYCVPNLATGDMDMPPLYANEFVLILKY